MCQNGSVAELSIHDIVAGIRAPDTLGIDDPDALVRKADRDKLARSLNGLLLGPTGQLFGDGLPLDLEQMCQPLTAGRTPLNILYLNALPDDHQKQFFVASLATKIYRWMVDALENNHGVNLLFYIDEARDFIPARARIPPAKAPLIRLFTQGRKYGVGCLLCTQSPQSVDYNVFGNCSTKIIGRLESRARRAARRANGSPTAAVPRRGCPIARPRRRALSSLGGRRWRRGPRAPRSAADRCSPCTAGRGHPTAWSAKWPTTQCEAGYGK